LNIADKAVYSEDKGLLLFGDSFEFSLVAAMSSRLDGNMSLAYGDTGNALNNRENFLKKHHLDFRELVCAKQTHSANVRYVTEEDKGKGALVYETAIDDTDAFITDKKNVPISIYTADCLPVFLYEPYKQVIGLVHGGWRSSAKNIAVFTVKMMQERFSIDPKKLLVAFGPGIRACCFEAEEEFKSIFPGDTQERNGKLYVDLAGANRRQLLKSGVVLENIFDYRICTACGVKNFYSFRAEKDKSGRMIAVMMLV